ncbi:phage holin family protein [Streptomyces spiramenti]|uniref:Phage holin family protein n=1 Tax=Streptomyces spiramenti TaxID=2720606 RepID=A0ABX1AQ12_9ACTN|nr:phage holin family protein [Streptomyces spiramenti]NJP67909.1 phage holin family protein [Streptomyces spiramenti]
MSAADEGRSIGKLVAEASGQVSELMRDEIALAKAKLREDVQRGKKGGSAGAVALVFLVLAPFPLTAALVFWLRNWWDVPLAIAFLVVGALYLVIAGIAGLVAKREFQRMPKPDLGSSAKESAAVLSNVKPRPREGADEGDRLPA